MTFYQVLFCVFFNISLFYHLQMLEYHLMCCRKMYVFHIFDHPLNVTEETNGIKITPTLISSLPKRTKGGIRGLNTTSHLSSELQMVPTCIQILLVTLYNTSKHRKDV